MLAIEDLRRSLIEKRDLLMRRRSETLGEEEELRDHREVDFPDIAADATQAQLLASMDDMERMELGRVLIALERIDKGLYGRCVVCGGDIPAARLRAMPEADRCTNCHNSH